MKMDTDYLFDTILHQIETSQLNFLMSKTPFSAQIYLKNSLIKRFQNDNQNEDEKVKPLKLNSGNCDMEHLKCENCELKAGMTNLEQTGAAQKCLLDEKYTD